ncbi:hypothetical protein RI129_002857 [Pyrocoelia pectoralis]|uniref:Transposase domain-containing protein n=1 Tax=Pyrocoelia pectoralis TaxID=417401 RepID=A0AAN7VG12_9COLE
MRKVSRKTYRTAKYQTDKDIAIAESANLVSTESLNHKQDPVLTSHAVLSSQLDFSDNRVEPNSLFDSSTFDNDLTSDNDLSSNVSLSNHSLHSDDLVSVCQRNNSNIDNNINVQIRNWALTHNIPLNAISDLLKILKSYFPSLPTDARSLLNTPRHIVKKKIEPGEYVHFGLRDCIEKLLSQLQSSNCITTIEACINIDGLPISKSSGSQIYPILCSLFENRNVVNVIGIYHGNIKPNDANLFLQDFVEEAIDLTNNGFTKNGRVLPFRIKSLIFDAPAKSFCTYTTGHSGYSSCSKCLIKGSYLENRVCFPVTTYSELRTDNDFRKQYDPNHHNGTSILELIPHLDMVQDIPLDYMHLICLGVVRKLIALWCGAAKPPSKLSSKQTKELSVSLEHMSSYVPCEFARKPRSLSERKRWKATEYRQFLYYTGPVVCANILNVDMYTNFLSLHVATTILSSPKYLKLHVDYSHSLFMYFVETFMILYGKQNVSHNIHNLIHIVNDAKRFGILDNFSAFPYENYLQRLKKLLRKNDNPLSQIAHRISEHSLLDIPMPSKNTFDFCYTPKKEHNNGPLLPSCFYPQYECLVFHNFSLKLSEANNCCRLKKGNIIEIKNFASTCDGIVIIGSEYRTVEDLYKSPCRSSNIGVYLVSDRSKLQIWNTNEILFKYFKIPVKDKFAVFPILHTEQ